MIISQINGGLGNQMFQYAAGRALSLSTGEPLKLDLTIYRDHVPLDAPRNYELDIFALAASEASKSEISLLKNPGRHLLRHLPVFNNLQKSRIFSESSFAYQSAIATIKGNVYLQGYWQSERYFLKYANTIRDDFQFPSNPNQKNAELLKEIRAANNSVSLHVRRGDYVSNATTNNTHGTCDLPYYEQAVTRIRQDNPSLNLYIFSDDPQWCADNLNFNLPTTYISHNSGPTAYEDIRLMSACSHNIIANSSFSWWGAWLNPNPKKIVIAPKQWFRDQTIDSRDLVPQSWVRL